MDSPEQNSSITPIPEEETSVPSTFLSMKPKRSVKPLVEGINAPVSSTPLVETSPAPTISLTNSERKLIEDPTLGKTTPPQEQKMLPKDWQPQGSSSWKKAAVGLFVIVLVIVGVVGGYVWYLAHSQDDTVAVQKVISKTTSSTPVQTPVVPAEVPSTAPTSTPTIAVVANQVKVTNTPTGFLNVRSTPSTSGELVTKVNPGDVLTYTEVKNGWYHVTLPDGTSGWVIATYVTKVK